MSGWSSLSRAQRRTAGLVVAAGVFSVLSLVAIVADRDATAPAFEERSVFVGLDQKFGDIGRIGIAGPLGSFTLERHDSGAWGVAEKHGFNARGELINRTVQGLADMTLIEPKTARADWHQHLDLVAPEAGGKGLMVTLFDQSGGVLASLLLGAGQEIQEIQGETRRYVRFPGEDQTWLAQGALEPESDINEWLSLDFLNIERDRVSRVRSVPGRPSQNNDPFEVLRSDPTDFNFSLDLIPAGFELSSPGVANGLGNALMTLTFDDVKPYEAADFIEPALAIFTTFDGLEITVSTARIDGIYWVSFAADLLPEEPEANEDEATEVEGVIEEDAVSERDAAREALQQEVARLKARAQGWAFKIPDWKGDQLTVAREAYLTPEGAAEELSLEAP